MDENWGSPILGNLHISRYNQVTRKRLDLMKHGDTSWDVLGYICSQTKTIDTMCHVCLSRFFFYESISQSTGDGPSGGSSTAYREQFCKITSALITLTKD
jgi:hypothetical protein